MCGIAGFELRGGDEQIASRLKERLSRRGPDGDWYSRIGPFGFVQTRLSVIDLSDRVRYPLTNESGELHLLFNGEIYGYRQERSALERRGHRFATDCDAEVVVHGYEEWGPDIFRRLDGMFAVALFHEPTRELVLARDRFGIKPLVHTTEGPFAFSSDALALVAAGLIDGAIDDGALGDYLDFHYVLPPKTGLRSLQQLLPGETLRRSDRGHTITERWCPRPFSRPADLAEVRVDEIEASLDRSVRRQLTADVPVGVFLSSGLDSSLVLDSAVRVGAHPAAFTIGFPGHGDYDEVPSAARFARDLGVPHHVAEVSGGFLDTLELVASAFDQPLGEASAIATTHLARLARKNVTVALSGTGGDDLFAGYYRHRAHLLAPLLGRVPPRLGRLLKESNHERGGERRSLLALGRSYLGRLAALDGSDAFSQYLELAGSASSPLAERALRGQLVRPDERSKLVQRLQAFRVAGGSTLRGIQAFELESYLPADLLAKEDRATMAVGLEARVPLLGEQFLELAERAQDSQKLGFLAGKRLLRKVARRRLPTYVTRARKRGFAVPVADLFAGPWRSEAIEWFAEIPSVLVDGRRASDLLRQGALPATDAWALAALIGWESSVCEAERGGAKRP